MLTWLYLLLQWSAKEEEISDKTSTLHIVVDNSNTYHPMLILILPTYI